MRYGPGKPDGPEERREDFAAWLAEARPAYRANLLWSLIEDDPESRAHWNAVEDVIRRPGYGRKPG